MPFPVGIIADSYNAPGGGGGFDPLVIPWHTALWAEDPLWTPPADGGQVSQWDDATGNGRHALQGLGSARPLYRASVAALNGQPAIDFVSNDFMGTDAWTNVPQPWSLVVVAHLRATGSNLSIVDGDDSTHRAVVGTNASGNWQFHAGTNLVGGTTDTNAHLFVVLAATSPNAALEVDGTVLNTGNAGTHGNTGLGLGGNYIPSGGYVQAEIAFVGFYSGDVRAHADWGDFEQWVEDHYGITIA